MKTLKLGSSGLEVKRMQNFLIGLNLLLGAADGEFGRKTEDSVRAYQRSRRLSVDGIVSNLTLAKMMAEGFALLQPVANDNYPAKPNFSPFTSNSERMTVFGAFKWKHTPQPGNREHITVLDNWAEENLVKVDIPQIKLIKGADGIGTTRRFHKKIAASVQALWADWEKEGLMDDILTYDGDYVPRLVRGSSVSLSNHAFGTAFDINAEWNGLGRVPPKVGQKGSVLRLVPLMHKHGFYSGVHFSRLDGMHVERSKRGF